MIIQSASKINNYPNISKKISEERSYVHVSDNIWHWYLESMRELSLEDYEVSQDSYNIMVSEITDNLGLVMCPKCHGTDSLCPTEITYERSLINTADEIADPIVIEVAVFYCTRCKTYHALIPWGAIPFSSFTYRFVIEVLYSYYFENGENKLKTAEQFDIPRSTLSSWIGRFKSDVCTVPELHELKDLVSSLINEDSHAFHENDLEKLRIELIEHLADYRVFLCAFLIRRMDVSGRPFMIPYGAAAKNKLKGSRFYFGKIICLFDK